MRHGNVPLLYVRRREIGIDQPVRWRRIRAGVEIGLERRWNRESRRSERRQSFADDRCLDWPGSHSRLRPLFTPKKVVFGMSLSKIIGRVPKCCTRRE